MTTTQAMARGGRQPVPTKQELAAMTPERKVLDSVMGRARELTNILGGDEDRFRRMAAVAVSAWRRLDDARKDNDAEIDTYTLMEAIAFSAMLGLDAGSDQVYLVPYKGRVSPIISPRGLTDLSYGSDLVIGVESRCVLQGDVFDYDNGTGGFIKHKKGTARPRTNKERMELLTHAYSFMRIVRGAHEATIHEVLTKDDIEFYRSFSKATKGPWFDNYEGMSRKTALKRMFPNGPRAPMLVLAMHEDDHGAFVAPPDWREKVAKAIGPAPTAHLDQGKAGNGAVPEVGHAEPAWSEQEAGRMASKVRPPVQPLSGDELKKISAIQAETVGLPVTAPEKAGRFIASVRMLAWPAERVELAIAEADQRLADAEEEARRMGGGDD